MSCSASATDVLEPIVTPKVSKPKRCTTASSATSAKSVSKSTRKSKAARAQETKAASSVKEATVSASEKKESEEMVDKTKKPKSVKKKDSAKKTKNTKSQLANKGHNKTLGKRGEDAAARFLTNHGYTILSRNYTCQFGEADIIARTPDSIVFVEVKTRTDEDKGMPEEAVTEEKRNKYEKIAISYLRDYEDVDIAVRFDVIGILVVAPNRAVVRHHINAFGVG